MGRGDGVQKRWKSQTGAPEAEFLCERHIEPVRNMSKNAKRVRTNWLSISRGSSWTAVESVSELEDVNVLEREREMNMTTTTNLGSLGLGSLQLGERSGTQCWDLKG